MDIEKLIEQLRWLADHCDRTNYGCHARLVLLDAATAFSMIPALQAENKQLKNKLSELAHLPFDEPGIGERTRLVAENAELRAELEQKSKLIAQQAAELERRDKLLKEQETELEQVKQKYGEAREAICTHCMDVPCQGESCYWWQGPEEG